jgi:hypothetical protein
MRYRGENLEENSVNEGYRKGYRERRLEIASGRSSVQILLFETSFGKCFSSALPGEATGSCGRPTAPAAVADAPPLPPLRLEAPAHADLPAPLLRVFHPSRRG